MAHRLERGQVELEDVPRHRDRADVPHGRDVDVAHWGVGALEILGRHLGEEQAAR